MVQRLAGECGDHFMPEMSYQEQIFNEQGRDGWKGRGIFRDMR
jgi:hypothetical protein